MQKTKRKPNTIRAKQKFYDYCVKAGIDLRNLDVERLNFDNLPKAKSTFKNRATEIKNQFNHIFKTREQYFMGTFPNIEQLSFEPKN